MRLIDLSLEIYHKMPRFPTHPPIIIMPFGTHQEIREADGYEFSSATLSVAMGDHTGTHVASAFCKSSIEMSDLRGLYAKSRQTASVKKFSSVMQKDGVPGLNGDACGFRHLVDRLGTRPCIEMRRCVV